MLATTCLRNGTTARQDALVAGSMPCQSESTQDTEVYHGYGSWIWVGGGGGNGTIGLITARYDLVPDCNELQK
jgi:hypothetical protein